MSSETELPNTGLLVPGYNQPNWQLPINFDLNLLDQIFGGEKTVPALDVTTLTVGSLSAPLVIYALQSYGLTEVAVPTTTGNIYTLSFAPVIVMGVFINGLFQRPVIDWSQNGMEIVFTFNPDPSANVYVTYFHV